MDLELEKGELLRESQAKDLKINQLEKKIVELNEKMVDNDTTQDYLREILRKREAEKKEMKKQIQALESQMKEMQ